MSGTEVDFRDGDLVVGMMHASVKARDLQRDGRYALHANPGDGSMEGGDAKVAGEAVEVVDDTDFARWVHDVQPPLPAHLFRMLLGEVVLTSIHPDGDRLLIELWRPGEPVRRIERA